MRMGERFDTAPSLFFPLPHLCNLCNLWIILSVDHSFSKPSSASICLNSVALTAALPAWQLLKKM